MDIISHPSPNFNRRAFAKPDMIIIHYTGMRTAQGALTRLCEDKAPRVSAHYFIHMNGTVYRLVDDEKRAWHAGLSMWEGETDINSRSIGIELDNRGHEHGYHAFPKIQINALIKLLDRIRTDYDIQDRHIVGHSDIAPLRKKDPGYLFPWDLIARFGHGIPPKYLKQMIYDSKNSQFIENLRQFGYACDPVSFLTERNRKVIESFYDRLRH